MEYLLSFKQNKSVLTNEKTDEERRARIYPVILSEYNIAWPEWYKEEKLRLEQLIGVDNIVCIHHIGSTAVPDLTAKPTIDIILEIKENTDLENLRQSLFSHKYICLREDALTIPTPPPHMMFLKGYLENGFAERVYHIHVRYPNDDDSRDKILFRDYLIDYPDAAKEYAMLKRGLLKNYKNDRNGYTVAKSTFINKIINLAKTITE